MAAVMPSPRHSTATAPPARDGLSRTQCRAPSARSHSSGGRRLAVGILFVLVLLGSLWSPQREARARPLDNDTLVEQATLETRQPEVQWSANGVSTWQAVPSRQVVVSGDRVRTGQNAAARLVYFEGTITEIGPETGLIVQRLERSPSGNVVATLLQSIGTTVSYVRHLVDPAAAFEIETPAAMVFVRGTTPRVDVGATGFTRVRNVPDGTASRVGVIGKDANRTLVMLQPGEETTVTPGQPPSPPRRWTSPPPTPTRLASPPALAVDPCQWPGASCDWRPPDPCALPGSCTPPPSTDPCQRPGVVCDPLPPDPCRQVTSLTLCNPPGGQGPSTPPGGQGPSTPPGGQGPSTPPGGQGPGTPPGGQGPSTPPGGQGPTRPGPLPGGTLQIPGIPTRVTVPDRPLPQLPGRPTRTTGPQID